MIRPLQLGFVTLASLLVLAPAHADMPRGNGTQTGDGSSAFSGLSSAPEASLFIGAATTSIPIEVPPGRNGLTPKLVLGYSSGAGPGLYGYGWDLPLGSIQRSTKRGISTCGDPYVNDYVLVLPGGSVECTLDASYRCNAKVEEAFARIEWKSGNWFDVRDKSGLRYTFGDTTSARAGANISAACLTSTWALTKITDPNGNELEITYTKEGNISRPTSIKYGKHAGGHPHTFEVAFTWLDRPVLDRITNGMGGIGAQLTKRLDKIDVKYLPSRIVRTYRFAYDVSPRIGRQSFLSSVVLEDGAGQALSRVDGLPASTVFAYAEHSPANGRFGFGETQWARTGQELVPMRRTERQGTTSWGRVDVLDMNADGIVDHVLASNIGACGSNWTVYLGSPRGFADVPTCWYVPDASLMSALRYSTLQEQDGCNLTGVDITLTWRETFDIDGDAIPDFVDASQLPWRIYKGTATAAGGGWGFSSAYVTWNASRIGTQRVIANATYGGNAGSATSLELRDFNGDGLADLVESWPGNCGAGGHRWNVWFNQGSSFVGTARTPSAPTNASTFTRSSNGQQEIGTYDVNGDGLSDVIIAKSTLWEVRLNQGRLDPGGETFLAVANWDAPSFGEAGWPIRWDKTEGGNRNTVRDFVDINGDGLPDIVDRNSGTWKVRLNRGNGFSDQTPTFGGYGDLRRTVQGTYYDDVVDDLFDADGDGFVDALYGRVAPLDGGGGHPSDYPPYYRVMINRHLGGAWKFVPDGSAWPAGYQKNPSGVRSDLLGVIENGVGGTAWLSYEPSVGFDNTGGDGVPDLPFNNWAVTRIERDDGLCLDDGTGCKLADGAHRTLALVSYKDGRFDSAEREFRGFYQVVEEDAERTVPNHRARATWFHQDSARSGKTAQSAEYIATGGADPLTQVISRRLNTWQCASPLTGAPSVCPTTVATSIWPRLATAVDYSYTGFSPTVYKQRTDSVVWWHQCGGKFYGNVAQRQVTGTGSPRIDTNTDYACKDDATTYIVDRPTSVWIADNNNTLTVERKWLFYDGQAALGQLGTTGNVTRLEALLDDNSQMTPPPSCTADAAKACVRTAIGHNLFGSVTSVTDALGGVASTAYDAATYSYPLVITNAAGHKVATEYDPGCGQLLFETNSYVGSSYAGVKRIRRDYDAFCRLKNVFPQDEATTGASQKFTYVLGKTQTASYVLAESREPHHPTGYVGATTFTDAFGRIVQQKAAAVVDGVLGVTSVSVLYDNRSNLYRRYVPVFAQPGALTTLDATPGGSGATTMAYDGARRLIQRTFPDGTRSQVDHTIAWETTELDQCWVEAGCVGGKRVELRDAHGRITETQLFAEGTASAKARTLNTFDGAGRLRESIQWDNTTMQFNPNTKTQIVYDSLGRKVRMIDPDSGTWNYGYDHLGRMRYQDDPKAAQHLQFCYDAIGRVTKKYVMLADFPQSSLIGCTLWADVNYTYDAVANSVGRLTRVEEDGGGITTFSAFDDRGRVGVESKTIAVNFIPRTATFEYGYDAADHLKSVRYPDLETVNYGYDAVGQSKSVDSQTHATAYLTSMTYDVFGRPKQIDHGNGTVDTRMYHGIAENYRLQHIITNKGATVHQNLRYDDYNANGLLSVLSDVRFPSGDLSASATYTYDGLGRLVQAQGVNLGTLTYDHDSLGNLILKEGVALVYQPTKPHTLATYAGVAVSHDGNGSRGTGLGQVYAYDRENRLKQVTVGADNAQMGYDYAGRQVWKVRGASVARYYSALAEVQGTRLTKYYFAGGLRVAERVSDAPVDLASLPQEEPAVRFARGPDGGSVLTLPKELGGIVAALGCTGLLLLVVVSGGQRPVARWGVRRGHVYLVLVALTVNLLPVRWGIRTADPLFEIAVGTGEAWGLPTEINHYHVDRLGSTVLVTLQDGSPRECVRYMPYGEVLGRYACPTTSLVALAQEPEFTGYETDALSGLQYAGARHYDPALGLFLTQDPAGQFPNPYSYGGWDPVNGTDPNGEIFFLIPAIAAVASSVAAVVTAASTFVASLFTVAGLKAVAVGVIKGAAYGAGMGLLKGGYAALRSGDISMLGEAVKNGAISGAISGGLDEGGLFDGLGKIARPEGLGLDSIGNASELAIRGAVAGATRGAIGGITTTAIEGGSFGQNVIEGVQGGAIGGTYDNTIGGALEKAVFAGVTQPVAAAVGVDVVRPGQRNEFGKLSDADPLNFRSMFQTSLLDVAVGGAVNGITGFPNQYIRGGVTNHGKFDASNLLEPFKDSVTRRAGNLGKSAAQRLPFVRELSTTVKRLTDF